MQEGIFKISIVTSEQKQLKPGSEKWHEKLDRVAVLGWTYFWEFSGHRDDSEKVPTL